MGGVDVGERSEPEVKRSGDRYSLLAVYFIPVPRVWRLCVCCGYVKSALRYFIKPILYHTLRKNLCLKLTLNPEACI